MDYSGLSLSFRIKKVIRYINMYGFQRTYMTIRSRWHMRKTYKSLPRMKGNIGKNQTVGIIGCGNYSFSNIAFFLRREYGNVIAACMDRDINRAASFARYHKAPLYTDNADVVIGNENIRLIYIASNHASHAEYAIKAIEAGKDVYIEKPHVVSLDQLRRLEQALRKHDRKVFLGFNRPLSGFGSIIRRLLHAAEGKTMISWFVIGHYLEPDHWCFNDGEGGRVLGDLCHWTDFTLRLMKNNVFPITIVPAGFDKSNNDLAINYIFSDGSMTSIIFSSQGYTFDGVRESFRSQKGNLLVAMDDFKSLEIELMASKMRYVNPFHDHGNKDSILAAYNNVHKNETYNKESEISHILNTAWLFLKTKEALDLNERVVIESYEESQKAVINIINMISQKRSTMEKVSV